MVRINLLPVREIKRRAKAKKQITLIAMGLVGLVLLLGFFGYQQSGQASQLQRQLNKVKQEKKGYTKYIKEIKELEEKRSLLEKRIEIIDRLKAESSLTVHILDEVAKNLPIKRMWLTSLSQNGNNLQLSGMALDNRTIAKYMEDLEKSPFIKSVNLTSSSLQAYAGRDLKSFSLACLVGVPAVEKTSETK